MALIGERRRFLKRVSAGLAASTLLPDLAPAASSTASTVAVKATTTDLTSDNERMIAYRHQQHMVQTADGALHIVINRGAMTPGPGLSLFSSFDGGSSWLLMQNFANTDDKSTIDLKLFGDDLWAVYHTTDQKAMFTQLHYDSVLRTWSVSTLQQAYASGQWGVQNPTLAVDDMGTIWVGFLARNRFSATGNIRVINCVGGGTTWTDPGLVFGPTDKQAVERSARMVRTPGGMGMVWTVHESTYWAKRGNGLPDNSAWTLGTIYTGVPAKQIDDPYASHFNVATDDSSGLHLISVENYDVLYFKYDTSADAWSAPLVIDDSRKVAYAQMGVANGKLGVGYSVQRAKGTLAISPDLGSTWSNYADLNMIAVGPGINLNTARVELPGRSTGVMPILQQYVDGVTQRLMIFNVPAP